ncbi:MAG: hypothetical protein M1816_003282 [Peltula sp. TS41687]|nr:MAG: hypothetical protein M1816_003282 [Peltula sp. TS41687]
MPNNEEEAITPDSTVHREDTSRMTTFIREESRRRTRAEARNATLESLDAALDENPRSNSSSTAEETRAAATTTRTEVLTLGVGGHPLAETETNPSPSPRSRRPIQYQSTWLPTQDTGSSSGAPPDRADASASAPHNEHARGRVDRDVVVSEPQSESSSTHSARGDVPVRARQDRQSDSLVDSAGEDVPVGARHISPDYST